MSQPFILRLTDNVEEVNFLSGGYRVMDGGFDISLPRAKRELAFVRHGVWQPASNQYEFREAKLRFGIRGSTRSEILERLHKLERILRQIGSRARPYSGRRGELSYAWDGSTDVTFFEVYGGDIQFPADLLSVAKIHAIVGGEFLLPDCELTLQLSPYGYGLSIYSDSPVEVPLYNPTVGAKTTGGISIQNVRVNPTEQYNYVEIDGADLPGSQPLITKITLSTGSPYTAWTALYMGLQAAPFPAASDLVFDSAEIVGAIGGSEMADTYCEGGAYRRIVFGSRIAHSFFSTIAWEVTNQVGLYYSFVHCAVIPSGSSFAIGVDDYVEFGIRYQEDYVDASSSNLVVPLGAIQLPPTGPELANLGTINPDLWLGLWFMLDNASGGTLGVDYISFLPMGSGLRVLRTRVSKSTAGTYYDDGWRGVQAFKASSGGLVSSPFYGLLDNLRLEPGITQRIYFESMGGSSVGNDKQRTFSVRVYAVPTYLTLAL
jgi:hypothetical protein